MWAFPLVVIGANPLRAYMVAGLFMEQIVGMGLVLAGGLAKLLEPYRCFWVIRNAAAVGILWSFLWFLYRKKVFWRV